MELPDNVPAAVEVARNVALAYGVIVVLLALTAGLVSRPAARTRLQDGAMFLAGEMAAGGVLFAGPALISIFAFYGSVSTQMGLLALWFGFIIVRPYELSSAPCVSLTKRQEPVPRWLV